MTFTAGSRVTAAALNGEGPFLLATASGSGSSLVLTVPSNAPSFTHLEVFWRARGDNASAAVSLFLQFNGDSGNNYLYEVNQANNTTVTGATSAGLGSRIQVGTVPAGSATSLYFGSGVFVAGGAADTTNYKTVSGHGSAYTSTTNMYSGTYGGQWDSAAAVTSLTLFPSSGNFVSGSQASLYGVP